MSSLKELLELRHSEDYERDFKALQEQVLPLMNQLAKENAELKLALEEKPLSDSEWPKDLSRHPANSQVPIRKTGRNGKAWKDYCVQMESAHMIDELREVILEMFNQGFLDTDVVDALFCTVKNGRRISLHNYNGAVMLDNKA
jgi:hypothetical protein